MAKHEIVSDKDTSISGCLRTIKCSCGWQIEANWNNAALAWRGHQEGNFAEFFPQNPRR